MKNAIQRYAVAAVIACLGSGMAWAEDSKAGDEPRHVELDTTTIKASSELPSVMAVVPWKKALPANLGGRPDQSLVDSLLEPLDPDVFRLQLNFYQQLFVSKASASNEAGKSKRESK